MKKFIVLGFFLFAITISRAQVIYVGTNILAPPIGSVNLNTGNSTEFRGGSDIILKDGFEVNQSGNTNTTKYFRAYIYNEYAPANIQYAVLEKEFSSGYATTVSGVLYFVYDEKYNSGILNYQIYDYMHTPLITSTVKSAVPALNLNRTSVGKNFFQVSLAAIPGFSVGSEEQRYFTLEVINDKNEKFVLRFKYL